MKRIFLILLSLLMMIIFSVNSSAKIVVDNDWLSDYFPGADINGSLGSTDTAAPSVKPEYMYTNNATLNFYISEKGAATVFYTVALKNNFTQSATATVTIEKKLLGPFWKSLSVKWTDTFSERYHTETITYNLDEEGTYRVKLKLKAGTDMVNLEKEFEYKKTYLKGDVNNDSKITAADARLVLRYSAKLESYSIIIKQRGDMNSDGKINAIDARILLRKASSLT